MFSWGYRNITLGKYELRKPGSKILLMEIHYASKNVTEGLMQCCKKYNEGNKIKVSTFTFTFSLISLLSYSILNCDQLVRLKLN